MAITHDGGVETASNTITSWWNSVPDSNLYIPASGELFTNLTWSIFGSASSVYSHIGMPYSRSEVYHVGGRVLKEASTTGQVTRAVSKVSGVVGVGVVALDVGNTWTAKNNNTNGQRVMKSGIQIGGAVLTGVVTAGIVNAWNPVGWGILGGVAIVGVCVAVGYGVSYGQNKIFKRLDIE